MERICVVCESKFDNVDSAVCICSSDCKAALEMHQETNTLIETTKPNPDPRIFFFPLTYGELTDKLIIYILRRAHCKRIKNQQELDYKIFKIRKSLTTHLCQLFHDEKHRNAIKELTNKLMKLNAKIFSIEERARDIRLNLDMREKIYFERTSLTDQRDDTIHQLEILVSSRGSHFKTYNGIDI